MIKEYTTIVEGVTNMIFKHYEGVFAGTEDTMLIMAEDLIAGRKEGTALFLTFNNAHGIFVVDKGLVRYMNDEEIKLEMDKVAKICGNEYVDNKLKKKEKKNFIMAEDLRDLIQNDRLGTGDYRKKAKEIIEKIGVEKWFKLKGYPTEPDSIWKNRYTGILTTLGEEVDKYAVEKGLQQQGFYLWENYLPEDSWNDKYLFDAYRKQEENKEDIKTEISDYHGIKI